MAHARVPSPAPQGGRAHDDDDDQPVWIFPSWRWVYAAVVVYTILLVALLHWFTVSLDHSAR